MNRKHAYDLSDDVDQDSPEWLAAAILGIIVFIAFAGTVLGAVLFGDLGYDCLMTASGEYRCTQ